MVEQSVKRVLTSWAERIVAEIEDSQLKGKPFDLR